MASRHRPLRDYKGRAEVLYLAARANRLDNADTRTDKEIQEAISGLRRELQEAEDEGCVNVAYCLIDSIRVLQGRIARRGLVR